MILGIFGIRGINRSCHRLSPRSEGFRHPLAPDGEIVMAKQPRSCAPIATAVEGRGELARGAGASMILACAIPNRWQCATIELAFSHAPGGQPRRWWPSDQGEKDERPRSEDLGRSKG